MNQFFEYYKGRTGLTVGLKRKLFSETSSFQKVEVFETDSWGNLMTIDDLVMLSEKDEFIYHEMISHPALFTHPEPKNVLIIGGGDGGTAREVLKHESVQNVDMVEIDETVVRASKLHFKEVGDFENPKLNVTFADGIQFVKETEKKYDVIIVDGSDPVGPATGLFSFTFFENCYQILNDDGILTAQSETPFLEQYHTSIKDIISANKKLYPFVQLYTVPIPLYPTGYWALTFASKRYSPLDNETKNKVLATNWTQLLKYFNSDMLVSSFSLPNFVKHIIQK